MTSINEGIRKREEGRRKREETVFTFFVKPKE
jgi:hypothetical protein